MRYNPPVTRRPALLLLNTAIALSLALCIATLLLWAASYSVPLRPVIRLPGTETWLRVTHQHGTLTAAWLTARSAASFAEFPDQGPATLGFSFKRSPTGGAASVPYALVAAALAAAPALRLHLTRKASRQAATLCPICNYDLRATPTRCPECGTIPVH
jgi:hypothetical protein